MTKRINKKKKSSKLIGLSFGLAEAKEIERRATAFHGMTTAGYLKLIVRKFMSSGERLELKED